MNYSVKKLEKILSLPDRAVSIPGDFQKKKLRQSDSLELAERYGFLKRPNKSKVITVFVTKGGVLKTSLTLNLARMAALHNIKTLVIGLDLQCDITTALGFDPLANADSLDEAENTSYLGLADLFFGHAKLPDIIQKTDLETLDLIPETPELALMDQSLLPKPRREAWLKEKVLDPLKEKYDLIFLDGSPNWNQLITNALYGSDLVVSPLECKINNFRNYKMFQKFLNEFKTDLRLSFEHICVPTRYSPARKLSREIYDWYLKNVPQCVQHAVKESVAGEEATAMHLSVAEYDSTSEAAKQMNEIIRDIGRSWLIAKSKETEHGSLTR